MALRYLQKYFTPFIANISIKVFGEIPSENFVEDGDVEDERHEGREAEVVKAHQQHRDLQLFFSRDFLLFIISKKKTIRFVGKKIISRNLEEKSDYLRGPQLHGHRRVRKTIHSRF